MDAFGHLSSWPKLTDFAQGPISKSQCMERTIITRSSLAITKLPYNATGRVVRTTVKPNQGDTIILKTAVNHA